MVNECDVLVGLEVSEARGVQIGTATDDVGDLGGEVVEDLVVSDRSGQRMLHDRLRPKCGMKPTRQRIYVVL